MKTIFQKIINLLLLLFVEQSFCQCFTKISSGQYHITAKKSDGTFWIWGSNSAGQFGNGTLNDEIIPSLILNNNYQYLTAGGFSTFAIRNNGTLWATGSNYVGNLGINSTISGVSNFTQVGTDYNWKDIQPSSYFTIAMKTNNNIWGWGQNDGYQMGNNTCCADQLSPTIISTDTDWKSIAASGSRSAFAIKNNGTLWCWGTNSGYLLSSNLDVKVPTQHNPDTNWDKMSLGQSHILILKTNGTLWSWGNGSYGETGDGLPSLYARYEPAQIGTANNWQSVSAGFRTSFGIKTDGTLWAWGFNDIEQLGIDITVNQPFPVQVGTANNWKTIVCGDAHTIGLKTDDSMWAWGDNTYGQLGNGNGVNLLVPTLINITGCTLANETFDVADKKVQLLPNPAKDIVNINYQDLANDSIIEIYDLIGRIMAKYPVSKTANLTIDTSVYAAGTYIVLVRSNNEIIIQKKLIKN